jgi:glycine hydroxymethyltransferase
MVEADMEEIAACIDEVLRAIGTAGEAQAIAAAKLRAEALAARYPLPYHL